MSIRSYRGPVKTIRNSQRRLGAPWPGTKARGFALITLCSVLFLSAQRCHASTTDAQAIDFVQNTWEIVDLTDSAITTTLDTSYSGIPFRDWIDFFINAPSFLIPLANGDYSTAGSKAYDYAQGVAIEALIEGAGLTGVVAPAQLAAWPIEHALSSFNTTVNDAAYRYQCKLYFQARVAGNTYQQILDAEPFELLLNCDIFKVDQGWLSGELSYVPMFPNFGTANEFFDYAENLWQANQAYHSDFVANRGQIGAQFHQAAAPGAPEITQQPQGRVINAGESATFTVIATGAATLTYQWYFNGSTINSAVEATLTASEAGQYWVLVSNAVGHELSQIATLTVNSGEPSIIRPPQNRAVSAGSTATFSVTASGATPLSYQWQRNGVEIPGAMSSSYTTPPVTSFNDGDQYRVRVSNSLNSITSAPAILSILAPLNITWTGTAGNGDWFNRTNWSPMTVPTASDTVVISSGSVNLPANSSFGVLNLNGGILYGGFTNNGTMNWTSGTLQGQLVNGAGAVLIIGGDADKIFSNQGAQVLNDGMIIWSGTGKLLTWGDSSYGPIPFENRSGGLWEISGDSETASAGGLSYPPSFAFENRGLLRKTGGQGTTTFGACGFINQGTVEVQSGTLVIGAFNNDGMARALAGTTLSFSGGTSGGTFDVASGTTVNVNGGAFNPSSLFTGPGIVRLNGSLSGVLSGQNLLFDSGVLNGAFTLNGTMNWTSGTLQGQLVNGAGAVLIIGGDADKIFSNQGAQVLNDGMIIWSGTGKLLTWGDSSYGPIPFENRSGGLWEISGDSETASAGGLSYPPSFAFENRGLLRKTGGQGTTTFGACGFINQGTVEVQSGTLGFNSNFTQISGTTRLEGGNLAATTPLTFNAGLLTGSGVITASLLNAAEVSPGASPGVFNINGNYTQSASGVLNLEIGGVAEGTEFDQLVISGTASLGGAIHVSLLNGFRPMVGTSFRVMTYGSDSGVFLGVNVVTAGTGLTFAPNYDATSMRLVTQYGPDTDGDGIPDDVEVLYGLNPNDATDALIDSDHDGRSNLLEYALGLNPKDGGDSGAGVHSELENKALNCFLSLVFNRRKNSGSIQYMPEVSADGINWLSGIGSVEETANPLDSEFDQVTAQDLTPVLPGSPRFTRLKVITSAASTSETFVGVATTIRGTAGAGPQYTFFSQPMVGPAAYGRAISGLSTGSLSDGAASWTDNQFNGANGAFYVEFDSGLMVDIADTAGSSKTLVLAEDVQGTVAIGDQYRIRQHATIASVFGANNEAGLLGAGRPQDADNIILYSAATQSATTYFYYPTPPFQGWWDFAAHPAGGVVIRPGAGLIVQRRASADVTFFATGPVREGPCQIDIFPGYNLTGTLKGKGLTLAGLNLYTGDPATGIAASASAATADKLIVINADGSATSYFYYKSALYQGWLNFAVAPSDNVVIPPGSAFYIERKPPNGAFPWLIPAD
jgi:Immunoglobulin I-set domain